MKNLTQIELSAKDIVDIIMEKKVKTKIGQIYCKDSGMSILSNLSEKLKYKQDVNNYYRD